MSVRDWLTGDVDEDAVDEDSVAARMLLILTGALLVQMSFRVWAGLLPGSLVGAGVIILLMATAVQLWVFAASGLDMERWGRVVGYGVLVAVGGGAALALMWTGEQWLLPLTTDESAFLHYSTQLVLDGQNPYAHSMLPALNLPGSVDYATPRIDGRLSDRLIYPAGSVLVFVPAVATGIEIRMVALVGAIAAGTMAVAALPPQYGIGAVASLLTARNIIFAGAAGDFDALWIAPMAAALILRADRRWLLAGLAFGVACSIKQIPWLAAPFLLIQHYRTGCEEFRGFMKAMAVGGAGFVAVNLPFFLADPGIWLRNVITPLSATLPKVPQGVGPSILSYTSIYPVSTTWHTVALVAVAVMIAVIMWLYPEEVGYATWLTPAPLLFVRLRSFNSYFAALCLIAFLAVAAQHGVLRARLPAVSDIRDPFRARQGDGVGVADD